jgi:OCT family organic cation transporter-like MFS transporter 4/5
MLPPDGTYIVEETFKDSPRDPATVDDQHLQKGRLQAYLRESHNIEEHQRKQGVVEMFKVPIMRKILFNLFFCWFVNALVYYGLSLNSTSLSGGVFLNFFFLGKFYYYSTIWP